MLNNAQEREDDEEGVILHLMLFKIFTIKIFSPKFEVVNAKYMYSVSYILALFAFVFQVHISR